MAKVCIVALVTFFAVSILSAFSNPIEFSDNHIDNRSPRRHTWPRRVNDDRVVWSTYTLQPSQEKTETDNRRQENKENHITFPNLHPHIILQPQPTRDKLADNRKNEKVTEQARTKRKAELACDRYRRNFKQGSARPQSRLPTMPGEFPYMGALAFKFVGKDDWSFQCGAALISENFALAPAHCLKRPDQREPFFLRLGKTTLQNLEDGAKPCDIGISNVIIHPGYSGKHKFHDLALLRLNTSIEFTKFVHPVCLNMVSKDNLNGEKFIATGWGKLFDQRNADALFKVEVNRISKPYCDEMYRKIKKLPKGLLESQVCVRAEHVDPKKCEGNSGGPLEMKSQSGQSVLYGMGSIYAGCFAEQPFVYTDIAHYIDWIESNVW